MKNERDVYVNGEHVGVLMENDWLLAGQFLHDHLVVVNHDRKIRGLDPLEVEEVVIKRKQEVSHG